MPLTMIDSDSSPPADEALEDDATNAPDISAADDERLGKVAGWVGSDDGMLWIKRITMGLALAFLVGAMGYFVGVRTTEPAGNAVDAGFLRDMSDHHDQAVVMAMYELANGSDPVVKDFALEVIMFQRQELGRFQNFQDERGLAVPEYDLRRTSMEWMGMSTPLEDMTGMATEAELKELKAAKGVEADKLFLTLMQNHHLGGAHMAEYEAEHGADPTIRTMAERMARNQRTEVREYQSTLDRLNGKK